MMQKLRYLALASAAAWAVTGCKRVSAQNEVVEGENAAVAAAANTAGGDVSSSVNAPMPKEADALSALGRMSTYLRTLKNFEVKATVTTETVLDDGSKMTTAQRVEAVASRPNKLRIQLSSDRKKRLFVYDGKTFTMFAPRQNVFAVVDAPNTIQALATMLEDKYDIELPLVDLVRWGAAGSAADGVSGARDVGPAEIDGVTCEQYIFRNDGLDWQVWIQQGEYPLPRKLVLTTLTDEARPQHTAIYEWNLAPSFDESAFAFVAPAGAKKITVAEARAVRAAEQKQGGTSQ
ncbi:MAG TPA: DUF2092 domain-containing protein [Gemmatimonadaceae bacterium]|nr:DUF2092 domain-containing protein [Gemmatimonadaceae bacterium]